jgi:AraC family transcriptional regulator
LIKAKDAIVSLDFRDEGKHADSHITHAWNGFSVERVVMAGSREFAYDWSGGAHYLAMHDLKLMDGEIAVSDVQPRRRLDLRDRLTMAPKGSRVSGWSSLVNRTNSFIALTYDPDVLTKEVEQAGWQTPPAPMVYFSNLALQSTMAKLQGAIEDDDPRGSAYAETLALLAVFEVSRMQSKKIPAVIPDSGVLSLRQQHLVTEFIAENLHQSLSLAEVSSVAGLSRFHFSRAFRRTFGRSPHAYILETRIDRAKAALMASELPISTIASQFGFSTQNHFSAAFKAAVGCTPSQFRRAFRGR